MRLLSALGLPEPKFMPTTALRKAVAGPSAKPKPAVNGKPVGPVVDESNLVSPFAGPIVDKSNIAMPTRRKTIERIDGTASQEAAADLPPPSPPGGIGGLPLTGEFGHGDNSIGLTTSPDGTTITVKHERKLSAPKKQLMLGPVPCGMNAALTVGVEGEVTIAKRSGKLSLKVGGVLEPVLGANEEVLTAGVYGNAILSATLPLVATYTAAGELEIAPFVVNVYGIGKIGFKIEFKDGPMLNEDIEVNNWHLYILHVGAYVKNGFESLRVEYGKDMQRFVDVARNPGKAVQDTVEKHAPGSVKKAAEDAARTVIESKPVGKATDAADKAFDVVKDKTGVDVGGSAEKVVKFLVDPDGETGAETTARNKRESEGLNSGMEEIDAKMQRLRTDLKPFCSPEERNEITDAWSADNAAVAEGRAPTGEWRTKAATLIGMATAKRDQAKLAAVIKSEKARVQVDEDLQRRVRESEARVVAAWKAMENLGNPLNQRMLATGDAELSKAWHAGMRFRDPGSLKMKQLKSFEGEARIAKADEVTGMFLKARAEFQRGSLISG